MVSVRNDGFEKLKRLGAVENVPLSELTSFRVGGAAALVLRPTSYEMLKEAVRFAEQSSIPFVLLGRGTNILASDDGYKGLVIRFDQPVHDPVFIGTRVRACCGTSLMQLARETVSKGFSGLERLAGIPGSLGGACAMNAGAYGAEIKQVLKRVRVFRGGVDAWVDVSDADLGYRQSVFTFPEAIALEAELELSADDGTAEETMRSCMEQRRLKQPLELPSAGSTFKRPIGYYAGALIEQCGLKGASVGGAQVSEKHAGFIVNTGNATAHDITALIQYVQKTVYEKAGVRLECEVKYIG